MENLLKFVQKSDAFDTNSKLKLILFLSGAKPSTYIQLRIDKNLHDKHEFEDLLKENNILFEASKPKGYEEITGIKANAAVWKLKGTWYGYDLFKNKEFNAKFLEYITLLKQKKHDTADRLAGVIYGYPQCCIETFIREHNKAQLAKKYSAYQYYKRLHDCDQKFPFISHTPCSTVCKQTKKLNLQYANAVKRKAPEFYKKYAKKRTYRLPLIVDVESSDIKWKKEDGHDYMLITKNPLEGRYCLMSWLSRGKYKRGTVIDATVTLQYDYAIINVHKKTGYLKNFHHERRFAKP
ncbi:Uncharacterised protein [uncultured archaeon]|nr:Uncharacterised protein [uncultured archaeon]